MASSGNLELQLRIQADLKGALAGLRQLETTLASTGAQGVRLSQSSLAAASGVNQLKNAASSATQDLAKTSAGVDNISGQLQRLRNIAGAVTGITLGAGMLKGIATTADDYTNLSARIRLVSDSNAQAATSFKSVIQLASETGQTIAATAELYTRMARSLKGSGATQTDLLQVTQVINKAAVVSGASAVEAHAAIIQLSQGLASGVLRGEEFNSVSEQMPRIMEMLQSSLGKTRGELRKMAEQGLLTTQVVFKALKDGAAEVDREFAQMPLTIGRASTEMANAWVEFVGGTNDALGATKAIAAVISGLASNLSLLTTAAIALAVVMGGRKVAAMVSATQAIRATRVETQQLANAEYLEAKAATAAAQAQIARARSAGILNPVARAKGEDALTSALLRQAAAEKALTASKGPRKVGSGAGLMGLMGGPMGLAITGVTLAIGGLMAAYAAVREHEQQLELQHRQTIQTLGDQTQKTLALVSAQGQLKSSVSTGEALTQQKTNADVLEVDAQKLKTLQDKAAILKVQLDALMSSPDETGFGIMIVAKKLKEVEQNISDITPKFTDLSTAQGKLSEELEQRLSRALDATQTSGKSLNQELQDLAHYGPMNWLVEATSRITAHESAFEVLSSEVDKLKPKLEKELADATYTAAEQLKQLRDNTIAAALAAGQAPADIDKLTASLDKLILLQAQTEAAKDSKRRSEAAAREAQSQAKSNESYVKGLEKQTEVLGKSQSQVRAYELAEKGLTGALRARAEAALATLAAEEAKQQGDTNATKNVQLQIQYLKALGDVEGGGLLEVRTQLAALRTEFEKTGNTDGMAWLDKLLPLQEAKVRVDALKKNMDDLFTYRAQQETAIATQVQAGLMSELQGRRELIALHAGVGEKITGYLPQLREMASLPGEAGENIRELIAKLEAEMAKLKGTTGDLTKAFNDGLESGIESSLVGLANGTMDLSDAVVNLGKSIVDAMAKIAAQELSKMAMQGLGSLTGGVIGTLGAATGGFITGPGSATSDSIPARLSNGEFVVNARAVERYGVDFMHSVNGGQLGAFSAGGLVSVPDVRAPAANSLLPAAAGQAPEPGATDSGASLTNVMYFDPVEALSAAAESHAGQKIIYNALRPSIPTLKQELGIK